LRCPKKRFRCFAGGIIFAALRFSDLSLLRDDFRSDSDVDVLVEFEPGQELSLMELVSMENELSEILGRKADMVERQAVEKSENYIRRRYVLQSLEKVYVA